MPAQPCFTLEITINRFIYRSALAFPNRPFIPPRGDPATCLPVIDCDTGRADCDIGCGSGTAHDKQSCALGRQSGSERRLVRHLIVQQKYSNDGSYTGEVDDNGDPHGYGQVAKQFHTYMRDTMHIPIHDECVHGACCLSGVAAAVRTRRQVLGLLCARRCKRIWFLSICQRFDMDGMIMMHWQCVRRINDCYRWMWMACTAHAPSIGDKFIHSRFCPVLTHINQHITQHINQHINQRITQHINQHINADVQIASLTPLA